MLYTARKKFFFCFVLFFVFLPILCDFKLIIFFETTRLFQKPMAYKRFPNRRSRKDFFFYQYTLPVEKNPSVSLEIYFRCTELDGLQ